LFFPLFSAAQHRSEVELSLTEPAIAPPLSLSAPELGSDEPFEMPPLRNAISSTEILHERTMARLYQDAAEEEDMLKNKMRKKSLERRPSLRGANVERKSSYREVNIERSNSFKDPKLTIKESNIPVLVRPRLNSEEREQLEFAKIRDKLRLKNEVPVKESEIRSRPSNLKQESSMSSQLSSYEGETGSEHYEGEVEESVEEEEELLEEEEEEDEFLGDESDEEMDSDGVAKMREMLEAKPPVPLHSILKKDAPKAKEEETYHPRSMVPTRGTIRSVQIPKEAEKHSEVPKITFNDEPDEPISLQLPLNINPPPASKIPVKGPKKSKLLDRIGFGRKKEKKKGVENLAENSVVPVSLIVLPKPILKKKTNQKKKDKDKTMENESPSRASSVERKKVRISEPGETTGLSVPVTIDPNASPLTQARQQRLQRRQKSLEEEEQANKVLIYHYSDIVKEYGGPKKTPPKLYMDIEELEAHADEPKDTVDSETATVASDAEERGSAPDMSEFDQDLESSIVHEEKEPTPALEEIEKECELAAPSPERSPSPCSSTTSSRSGVSSDEAVRSMWEYVTDVAIFMFACWLYLFKSEIYVIPVLILLVYRQLQITVKENYAKVRKTVSSKVPKIVMEKIAGENVKLN